VPTVTSDIYPTLLEIAGVEIQSQPPLDGISLVPLFDGHMDRRPDPMGFWRYPAGGLLVPGAEWMGELLEAQQTDPTAVPDSGRLHLGAGNLSSQYPVATLPGHAAWLDWPWKLHRIETDDGQVEFELYDLEEDPLEESDLAQYQTARVASMMTELGAWQRSVVRSLNGQDYR
jgi:arylsulfatase A-like enzyme